MSPSGFIQIVKETALNKVTPVGPLALALRLRGASKRTVFLVTALACTTLLIGIGLLLT
ncbi:hypothetical protein [Streptomyces sp. NBC_01481]|uniref:hypothetical protein n=1 Tax=Streptomyces sp. NBC_01481 TaxID=2975869 RepID=UPI0022571DDF|nr:hypothetical protein [Streptomyces sp. NBC_01481]